MPAHAAIHILLHFLVPAAVARVAYPHTWRRAALIMMATILVDIDHFLVSPLYDPVRCSIGFHPLHTWPAMVVYFVALFSPKTRLVGMGLLIHMVLDGSDCVIMKVL